MMTAPRLPRAVRLLNWGGRKLRRLGIPPVRLDEDSLLGAARKKTGLSEFGGDSFREGLQRLLAALEAEAHLHTLGRLIARTMLVDLLVNRLRMTEVHRQHPEIAGGAIRRPMFVIGLPRTGTTILHHLLAQDPGNRTPLHWEVERPCPPPERATYETDPRIAEVDAQLARTDRLIPDFKKIHPMAARWPQECVAMMCHAFASLEFSVIYRIPSYTAWLHKEADFGPVYASHRRMAQLLQWHCPAERWIFKSPGHLWTLRALLAEYPDAILVQTHRDPLKILASLTSLMVTLTAMTSDSIDPVAIAREWSDNLAMAFDRSVDARESGLIKEPQVIDIHFHELMADTIGSIRRIYDHCGLSLSSKVESRMRRHLEDNPGDKHGKHTYRFVDTGLDLSEERRKVKRYQEFFGVRSEADG